MLRQWLIANPRDYDFASAGRASEEAVWSQLLVDETTDENDDSPHARVAATAMLDIIKAFEHVGLVKLWQWGQLLGMEFLGQIHRVSPHSKGHPELQLSASVSRKDSTCTLVYRSASGHRGTCSSLQCGPYCS